MKKNNIDAQKLKDSLAKGLELTFKKLLKQKKADNGTFVFSQNGLVKKIKASNINY